MWQNHVGTGGVLDIFIDKDLKNQPAYAALLEEFIIIHYV